MNKRYKILFSTMTLCVALAMMVFGIFAATQVTYNVTGKVSYTVSDVYCSINTAVYYSADFGYVVNELDPDADSPVVIIDDEGVALEDELVTPLETEDLSYATGVQPGYTAPEAKELPTFTFKADGEVYTAYRIVVTVTIPAQSGNIKIEPTCAQATAEPGNNAKVWFYLDYNQTMSTTRAYMSETNQVISLYVLLQDKTKNIAEEELEFTLSVAVTKV